MSIPLQHTQSCTTRFTPAYSTSQGPHILIVGAGYYFRGAVKSDEPLSGGDTGCEGDVGVSRGPDHEAVGDVVHDHAVGALGRTDVGDA